jgi:hypothetical protein
MNPPSNSSALSAHVNPDGTIRFNGRTFTSPSLGERAASPVYGSLKSRWSSRLKDSNSSLRM